MVGPNSDSRGQAYTIESVVGGILVLTAVLFALQSVVVTPTTGGSIDAETKGDVRQQADDVLVTAAQNESFDLNAMVRYWDQDNRTFRGAANPEVGYGARGPPGNIGTLLEETFSSRGWYYNLELRYLHPPNSSSFDGETGSVPVVYQGTPADDAVVSTHRVTLYDNQTLSSPTLSTIGVELWELDTNATDGEDGYYPIPNAEDGPVYNVVEVRLVVW